MTSSKLITSYKIERQARHELAAQSCTKSRIVYCKNALPKCITLTSYNEIDIYEFLFNTLDGKQSKRNLSLEDLNESTTEWNLPMEKPDCRLSAFLWIFSFQTTKIAYGISSSIQLLSSNKRKIDF